MVCLRSDPESQQGHAAVERCTCIEPQGAWPLAALDDLGRRMLIDMHQKLSELLKSR